MRRMSFALTTDQILNQTKTVTRRKGWLFLREFDSVRPVEKCMGLKKGEKQKVIGEDVLLIKSVSREPINAITQEDVVKEGFPGWTTDQFIELYCKANKCKPTDLCTRIEFYYLPF